MFPRKCVTKKLCAYVAASQWLNKNHNILTTLIEEKFPVLKENE